MQQQIGWILVYAIRAGAFQFFDGAFDLVLGLDRSDRTADLYLIDSRSGQTGKQTIATSPEALQDWLARLRQQHPQGRVALGLEQPAASLILFLETYSWITLYAINPITLQKFREAFVTSRATGSSNDSRSSCNFTRSDTAAAS